MDIQVIETHEESGIEWGVSFSGHNPEAKDYFPMRDKEEAFRLKEKVDNEFKNTYKIIDLPSDEPVQYVGVYTLRWRDNLENPEVGFVMND